MTSQKKITITFDRIEGQPVDNHIIEQTMHNLVVGVEYNFGGTSIYKCTKVEVQNTMGE